MKMMMIKRDACTMIIRKLIYQFPRRKKFHFVCDFMKLKHSFVICIIQFIVLYIMIPDLFTTRIQ